MKYEIIIYWSNADNVFVAEVPELEGCMAHGDNEEMALHNIKEAIDFYIQVLKDNNKPIPKPKGKKLMFA